ncbi:hypothetical protein ACZ11_23840 [Lysinibacillus xylanilyticus]|uniref:HNH domain-containing protein n=1 Tax=Lysinibacillus xylanilyticus TaxID=582475 RepID=A0A0K9F114_9BACI|nr:hypothetical protein ACZ11_23840 [Lysinibacillus xylanilyticus]
MNKVIYIELSEKKYRGYKILDIHKEFIINNESEIKSDLDNLRDSEKCKSSKDLIDYLDKNLTSLAIGNTESLKKIQDEYIDKILDNFNINNNEEKVKFTKLHLELKKIFIKAYRNFKDSSQFFEYEGNLIEWNAYRYVESLNTKICPYCHAQYINPIRNNRALNGAGKQARPHLDHFIPISMFPIFSISLYNLVPSCYYCNSYFKSNYYTDFDNCFSPYEKEIEHAFTFSIEPMGAPKNSFDSLKAIRGNLKNTKHESYYKLISTKEKLNKNIFHDYINLIESKLKELNVQKANVRICNKDDKTIFDALIREFEKIHKLILNNILEYSELSDIGDRDVKERICEEIVIYHNQHVDIYNNLFSVKMNGHSKFRSISTFLRDTFKEVISNVYSLEFKVLNFNEEKKFNFVEVIFGETSDYDIKILPTHNIDNNLAVKVLTNVSLFQLESVYSQYRNKINNKNKQRQILSKSYLEYLAENFPDILGHEQVLTLTEGMFYTEDTYRDEILGKLIFNLYG